MEVESAPTTVRDKKRFEVKKVTLRIFKQVYLKCFLDSGMPLLSGLGVNKRVIYISAESLYVRVSS